MGLITGIYNMVRQSEQDELQKKRFEAEMADRAERRRLQSIEQADRNEARNRIGQGVQDIAEMSSKITQDKVKMARLEKTLPMLEEAAASNPSASQALMMARVEYNQLADGIDTLERTMSVRKAILPYEMIDAGLAKQKAVDVMDALNGIQQKEQGNDPMVKIKSKRKGQEFGDEDEVTYEVPASIADRFVRGEGVPLPSSVRQPTGAAAQPAPMNFSTYSAPMFGNAAPASTGEQAVDSSMLFGGQKTQVAQPENPFITTRQASYPEGSVLRQGGKRYKVINGTPTEIQ